MPTDYLDTSEALRQLNLYFDVDAMRANLLHGERAARWEEECSTGYRRLWELLREVGERHGDEKTQPLHNRAAGHLADAWDVPPLVSQRGLRPETAAHLLSILNQLQVALFRLRIRLRELEDGPLAARVQESLDELTLPTARLAAHVHALASVYDLLMVRPAYRVLEHWLYGAPVPADSDEEGVEM
jgi:hypothetical protein